jgi:hypothetical protein
MQPAVRKHHAPKTYIPRPRPRPRPRLNHPNKVASGSRACTRHVPAPLFAARTSRPHSGTLAGYMGIARLFVVSFIPPPLSIPRTKTLGHVTLPLLCFSVSRAWPESFRYPYPYPRLRGAHPDSCPAHTKIHIQSYPAMSSRIQNHIQPKHIQTPHNTA